MIWLTDTIFSGDRQFMIRSAVLCAGEQAAAIESIPAHAAWGALL
jgi:hypothetical protein